MSFHNIPDEVLNKITRHVSKQQQNPDISDMVSWATVSPRTYQSHKRVQKKIKTELNNRLMSFFTQTIMSEMTSRDREVWEAATYDTEHPNTSNVSRKYKDIHDGVLEAMTLMNIVIQEIESIWKKARPIIPADPEVLDRASLLWSKTIEKLYGSSFDSEIMRRVSHTYPGWTVSEVVILHPVKNVRMVKTFGGFVFEITFSYTNIKDSFRDVITCRVYSESNLKTICMKFVPGVSLITKIDPYIDTYFDNRMFKHFRAIRYVISILVQSGYTIKMPRFVRPHDSYAWVFVKKHFPNYVR